MIRINSIGLTAVMAAVFFLCGCQESNSSDQIRRAQIIANQNITLTKQVKEKDAQIADLNEQLQKAKEQNEAIQAQHGEIYLKLMQTLSECQTKLEKYEPPKTN
jgi:hypothetical protein